MFDNIGGKIKSLAQITCWIGIVCSVIWGMVVWAAGLGFLLGLCIMVLGSLGSWISAFTLYGFGQLIENSDYQKDYLKKLVDKEKKPITVVHREVSKNSDNSQSATPEKKEITHRWACNSCHKMRTQSPCEFCGAE